METTEKKKKHNGGYYLKEKIAKLENELAEALSARNNYSAQLDRARTDVHNLNIEVKELKSQIEEANQKASESQRRAVQDMTTIEQQSRKISQLTADLHNSETLRLNADAAHSKKEGEMLRAMGPIRRWWWNLHHLPTFKEDERWNETH